MLRFPGFLCVLGAAGTIIAGPASAQVTVGADVGAYSAYVWRGLTLTSKPVIQPDLYLGIPVASGVLTLGGWANIEPGRYNGANNISESGGLASPDLAEFDWWADYTRSMSKLTWTLGATGYIYPNHPNSADDFAIGNDKNTIEAYGKFGLDVPLAPKISAYYDFSKVKGLYVEGGITQSLPLAKSFSLTLGALGAWNSGQGINPSDPSEIPNFASSGFTHADFSVSTSFDVGSVSIVPIFHFLILSDGFTRFTERNETYGNRIWFGATLSWATGGEEEAEPASE